MTTYNDDYFEENMRDAARKGNRWQPEEQPDYVTNDGNHTNPEGKTEQEGEWARMGRQTDELAAAIRAIPDDEIDPDAVKADPVNHPRHYGGFSNGAEVIDLTENLTFSTGNAVKYLCRAGRIDGRNKGAVIEDLRKAAWYVARELKRLGVSDA